MENGLHRYQGGTGTGDHAGLALPVAIVVDIPDHVLICRTVLPRHLVTGGGLFRSERCPGPELAGGENVRTGVLAGDGPLPALSCRKNLLPTWSRSVAPAVSIVVVLRPVVPSWLKSCWSVASCDCNAYEEPETTSDWLFQLPLLSTVQTMYWSALPFFQTTW